MFVINVALMLSDDGMLLTFVAFCVGAVMQTVAAAFVLYRARRADFPRRRLFLVAASLLAVFGVILMAVCVWIAAHWEPRNPAY